MNQRILIYSLLAFTFCSKQNEPSNVSQTSSRNPQIEIQIEGKAKKGFLVGIEPYLEKTDYQTEDTFYQILKLYFSYAKKEEIIATERTVIILPEYIGTWLVASGEDSKLFEKQTLNDAMEELALNHLGRFLWVFIFEKGYATDRLRETLFRMKSWQMAETYQNVFSRLAVEFRVDIVAGSIVLPEPRVVEGKITVTDGPLQNVSFYFHSDGSVDPKITKKQFLIDEEKTFLSNETKIGNPVYKSPLGLVYTMICADSWYPEAYEDARNQSAEILVVPSLVAPAESWNQKWLGYNGRSAPKDVNLTDIKNITEWQAWKKYALIGKGKQYQINTAMNVFFNGAIWDLDASGSAFILMNAKQISIKKTKGKNLGMIYAIGL